MHSSCLRIQLRRLLKHKAAVAGGQHLEKFVSRGKIECPKCRYFTRGGALLSFNHSLSEAGGNSASATIQKDVDKAIRKYNDGRSDGIIGTIVEYFTDANEDIISKKNMGKRGNIQLVAGSGKTFIAWNVMEDLLASESPEKEDSLSSFDARSERAGGTDPKICLYVIPYLHLIDQALDNREAHGIMTEIDGSHMMDTLIVASGTRRIRAYAEDCTTDVGVIMEFLTKRDESRKSHSPKILVCTYNSLYKVGKAIEILNQREASTGHRQIAIDLAVFDEAHKMEGLTIGKSSTNGFSYGLCDSNIHIRNRLFMTGTPNNYEQEETRPDVSRPLTRKKEHCDPINEIDGYKDESFVASHPAPVTQIRSFLDETLFGPCLAKKTYCESVEENTTLPISLYGVETSIFSKIDAPSKKSDEDGNMRTDKDYFLPIAIRSAFEKLKIKHAVSFHSTNSRARRFLDMAKEIMERDGDEESSIQIFNMDHTFSPLERSETLKQAKAAPRSLITNCKILSMGVDNASWDLVIIADPVNSSVDGRQMIGRVGRKAPGKDRGYVLVPVPDSQELLEGTKSDAYQIFANTFQHMVSLNPELRRHVNFVLRKRNNAKRPLTRFEYPDHILEAFVFPNTMSLEYQNELMSRAIVEYANAETSAAYWNKMFELLVVYKKRVRHCNVPQSYQVDGQNLGVWLSAQRRNKKKGTLDKDLEERLTNLGVVWDPNAEKWDRMFKLLKKYKAREGHCNVPQSYQVDGQNLGVWLDTQRQNKKRGILDENLEERLTNLGVVWEPLMLQWDRMFKLLKKYKAREGHCNVPRSYQVDGQNLGTWLDKQRRNKKRGILDENLEERLTNLGVVWEPLMLRWDRMFKLLKKYKAIEGHCNVPQSYQVDGQNLGVWLSAQRRNKKKGTLDKDLEERLTNLGVVWEPLMLRWDRMFKLLKKYKVREGHCNVPQSYQVDGQNLGVWLSAQRTNKKKGILDENLEERLTNLGVVWAPLAQ